MTLNRWILATTALAIAGAGCWFALRNPRPDPVGETNVPRQFLKTDAPPPAGVNAAPSRPSPVSVARLCAGQRPPAVPSVRLREVLEKNGNDPLWCAAAVDVSGELAFLRVSLRQWPDSPDLLVRGMNLESTPEARAECARRLAEIMPDHSWGRYGLAAGDAETGNFPAMIQNLRAALKGKAPVSESPEVAPLRRELWMAAGFTEAEALLYNSCATGNHLQHALTLTRSLDALKDRLAEPGLGEDREELAMLGVACAEHFRQTDGLMLNILAMDVQTVFLKEIDSGAAFGETGNTVGSQLRLVEKDLEAVREEFAQLEEKTGRVTEEEFTDPSNFWMALAEYNAFRGLKNSRSGASRGR